MTSESQVLTEAKESSQVTNTSGDVGVLAVAPEQEKQSPPESIQTSFSALAAKLPLQLDLRVPLPSFRVQNLLSLEKGQVVESAWPHTEDLPLWSGGVHLVWTEFEVVDQKLAVRVTRLV
jgi:flagellar motor switch protein FliN/FliY